MTVRLASAAPTAAPTLDDTTACYVAATQPGFTLLRAAAVRLSGCLLLVATDTGSGDQRQVLLGSVRENFAEADDLLGPVSAPDRALHHHHHIKTALALFKRAEACARRLDGLHQDNEVKLGLDLLSAAWRQLQFAADTLPGFEIINLGESCCAFCQPRPAVP